MLTCYREPGTIVLNTEQNHGELMEEFERHDIYFIDRTGHREIRDPLPYFGTLDGAKKFCVRYFEEVGSRYYKAEIYRQSDPLVDAAYVENPNPQ